MTQSGNNPTRASLFRRVGDDAQALTITVDGRPVAAQQGDSLATALIAGGLTAFARNPKTGALNSPACLIGICFGCLCEVDGRPGVQACLTPVRDGMQVRTGLMDGFRDSPASRDEIRGGGS
ncbi:MAG: (2Fe-2S)-binding protein [Salinarimonas sp.]